MLSCRKFLWCNQFRKETNLLLHSPNKICVICSRLDMPLCKVYQDPLKLKILKNVISTQRLCVIIPIAGDICIPKPDNLRTLSLYLLQTIEAC